MVVVRCTHGGAYILAEVDGSLSKLWYAAFRIVPYLPQSLENIPVASLLSEDDLDNVVLCSEDYPLVDEPSNLVDYLEGESD